MPVRLPGLTLSSRPTPPAPAGDTLAPASETVQEVTVTAHCAELEKRVSEFVYQIAQRQNFDEGLARWRGPVSPVVAGSVVVEQARLLGISLGQFADDVAMAGLAQIKVGAHLGDAPTILKLFDGALQRTPAAMSDWDQTFLKILVCNRIDIERPAQPDRAPTSARNCFMMWGR